MTDVDTIVAEGVVPLGDARAVHGGKAAQLGAMIRAGLNVPQGFVIPASLHAERLEAAVRTAHEALGAPAVAVRSSAAGEDAAGSSFAGQYETVLDVQGVEALLAAIERCRASARSARVQTYAGELGAEGGGLSVLVQRMVPARAAGVAFTADPVTGERDVVRVSAVAGLGEGLVSGAENAEEWAVRGESASRADGTTTVLRPDEALAVAGLAREVEAARAVRRTSSGRSRARPSGCCRRVRSPLCPTPLVGVSARRGSRPPFPAGRVDRRAGQPAVRHLAADGDGGSDGADPLGRDALRDSGAPPLHRARLVLLPAAASAAVRIRARAAVHRGRTGGRHSRFRLARGPHPADREARAEAASRAVKKSSTARVTLRPPIGRTRPWTPRARPNASGSSTS